jgi:hypothetical protein
VTSVRARAGTDAGGWIEVPPLADTVERDRWTGAVVDAVARAHDRFDPDAAPPIRQVLAELADDREEADLLVLAFLPSARPILAAVRVRMIPSPPLDWWRERGFVLSPIHAAGAGHGMLASRTIENSVEGQRFVAHQTAFVFNDGDLGVVVFNEPTAALVFDRMQEGLTEIVASLTLEYDDGRTFEGARVAGLPGTDADTWDIGMHVTA